MPPAPVSAVTANRREAKQRLLALARQQGGVVRWDQAQDLGLTRGQLRSATERGDWQQHR
ncbi:MAG: type IV toxin-antitoxin system AbiEi family antitoxin domain-containing protein, partial [Actinomycetes bacterium]